MKKVTAFQPETPRLTMRQWQESDLPHFAAMNADSRVMEYFPAPLSTEESNALAKRCRERIQNCGWGLWAVELKSTAEFIGFVGLSHAPDVLSFAPCIEIGWRLNYSAWGHGYATEAARAALRVGFEELNLSTIVSFTAIGNRRSRAVMERLGMTRSSTFLHPKVSPSSGLQLHVLYRIAREVGSDTQDSQ
ncbi:acetyltransferase, including N-acetylase of ribosomal protein [Rubidibacter lacunae KORDI 51-2]|uniref:Acetyltransferase, including N-acetylase of ribosomal protein n=1 Tax=Rubidibacter lacunae KORDI 51-2 TaxID=582515 RepID=U5DMI2_9CHRO|nr:GNAT family N-acetyltransferase [Rubidibacter lacunae]ERN42067.1 acetyltransferase, including N-acetylase of ribosomal protein [Rubidibacter lacunae KORDI 51-2]